MTAAATAIYRDLLPMSGFAPHRPPELDIEDIMTGALPARLFHPALERAQGTLRSFLQKGRPMTPPKPR